ncbi:GntR family transcriptional regulator/MocR family aminotransferase [Nocardioides albertanoniae]|uniref:GntR family transcriptional regulator/MocR family aminotransferase n=1 Tax=Nocardioides albertanoniae TaxID=1175486 RepID=A0A543AAF0_9ACTN|nr:PLP-dependent aminotransferase family protein [Nocardioides albertanoniae]TQL69583.1 GntR family transcriptional regulator/MocR family aminotransferase [Nocardioides albertanoniae]
MLPVTLDRTCGDPLPAQLASQIRTLVLSGTLSTGDRLPSTRALAADLGVSRAVTEHAYDQLSAEGWLEARRGSGTFVTTTGATGARPQKVTARPARATPRHPGRALPHLDTGTPFFDPRLEPGWRRAWREVSATTPPRGYDDPRGLPELREALAARLGRTRGLEVRPDEIIVTAGTTDGLRAILPELRDGPVAVEDPGYRAAAESVRIFGREVIDLPAAETVADLGDAVAAYLTPAHQHPLGRVMPAADRLRVLDAARRADAVVIEDDYDSEFRYDVAPVPAMATLDRSRVTYLGTAAKSVVPTLRLGWLVAPPDLHERILHRRTITHSGAAWPSQRALLTLLRDGWLDRAVRSARRVYAERAPRVAEAMSPYATLAGPLAGMYSTWLMPEPAAVRAREAARAAGFEINLLSGYARSSGLTGLVIGFGGVSDDELDAALDAVTGALGPRS